MLPPFVNPVQRPEFIYQARIISFMVYRATLGRPEEGNQITELIYDLIHGANYNNPQHFLNRSYNQLKTSMQSESLSFGRFRI